MFGTIYVSAQTNVWVWKLCASLLFYTTMEIIIYNYYFKYMYTWGNQVWWIRLFLRASHSFQSCCKKISTILFLSWLIFPHKCKNTIWFFLRTNTHVHKCSRAHQCQRNRWKISCLFVFFLFHTCELFLLSRYSHKNAFQSILR